MKYVFEIYPIRHQVVDKNHPQLWQWRLKYGRKVMCCGVEMGPGGRHGYASKRGAYNGLKSTARAFGLALLTTNGMAGLSLCPGTHKLCNNVDLVVREAA